MKLFRGLFVSGLCVVSCVGYASDPAAPHWSYSGEHGPAMWAKVSESFHLCEGGATQSPIDLTATVDADLPSISFSYKPVALKVQNNGHTLQVNVPEGSSIKVGDDRYQLVQLHFHTPSEYHIEGKSFPLEVHYVHKREDGTLGVIGVMFKEGKENSVLEAILKHAPQKANETYIAEKSIDLMSMLPADLRYYRLMGSLTTPPCSEGVHWHVMVTPITASAEQIEKFKGFFAMNARPLQPSKNRLVVKDTK